FMLATRTTAGEPPRSSRIASAYRRFVSTRRAATRDRRRASPPSDATRRRSSVDRRLARASPPRRPSTAAASRGVMRTIYLALSTSASAAGARPPTPSDAAHRSAPAYPVRNGGSSMRALLSLTSILTVATGAALLGSDWPSWRGPSNNGVSPETGLPVTWSATCADAPAAAPEPTPAPAAATPPPQGQRGQRGRGRGGREGRPLTPFSCDTLETENVAWKIPLPAYS